MSQHWLEVRDISKNFGGVRALSEVGLDIAAGEIHALMGENGAGKSTLIKILGGALTPDAGSVSIAGAPLSLGSVRASEAAGIAVIHQECVAFGDLGAADNIFVGREPRAMGGLLLDRKQMRLQAKALLDRLGEGGIDINRPVGELALAQRQMVAIARALSHRCKLLIMDEPTASLSAREATNLFAIVRQLKAAGVSILYVSHRMEEIYALSDRVSVLRDGRYVGTAPTGELKEPDLIRMMVGRELLAVESEASPGFAAGPTALELRKLSRAGAFVDISMNLRRGEIVGLGGLVGAGRSEVARAVFGIDRYDSGEVHVDGRRLAGGSVRAAMSAGLALAPEDRQSQGLIPPMSVGENLSLPSLPALSRFGWIRSAPKNRLIGEQMRDMRVKAASPAVPASTLSGGNQQKLVLGKWLAMRPKVLLLDEPTRGVDVGAKAEIYQLIRKLARAGAAILVISSDLPELLAISHRILVMRTGRIAGELSRAEATQEKLLELAMPLASPSPSPETSEAA